MQLMTFNSLLMFDIVFMFFLFLVGVTCLVYYLPTGRPHRPFVQTAESLLEAEKCRYRHRHLHLLSQKNGHTDRILTDEGSVSEYEDDEDDINDDESDEFDEIPTKNQSKKHSQQQQQQKQQIHLQHEQHNCHIHSKQNQNDKLCSDTKEINYIERNEIELVKLRNKGYYPLPRQRQHQQHLQQQQPQQQHQQQFSQGKENSHKSNKILYHCCPPCNLSDCENFYISYDDPSNNIINNSNSNTNISKGNNNNDIYNNSNIITTYNDTDSIGITIDNDNTISSTSRLMYLKEIPSLENLKNKGINCTSISNDIQFIGSNNMIGNGFTNTNTRRNIDENCDDLIGIHNNSHLNDRKQKCNIDCTKKSIHPLLKSLKSRAIINNKKQMMTATKSFKNNEIIIEEAESTYNNKIQSISTLPTSISTSTRNGKTNVPDDDTSTHNNHNQNDIDNDIDDDFEEYNEEDDDDDEDDYNDDDDDDIDDDNDIECCSTTSVDIVLAEGIDDDASNVIIYGNKRKCQHNCRNRYNNINSNINNMRPERIIKTKTGTVAQESSINNNNYKNFNKINSRNNDNSSQQFKSHFTTNINAATVAATLREHFYVIKETEKNQDGTTAFCNNCNLSKNYSTTSSSTSSSYMNSKCSTAATAVGTTEEEISTRQLISSPLSSAHQILQSCNNIPCPLLSSSSSLHHCTKSFNSSPLLLNTSSTPLIPSLSSYNISTSPPGSPILSTELPYISLSPSSGLRFSSSSSNTLALAHQPYCCHVKAKSNDLKDCVGPIVDV